MVKVVVDHDGFALYFSRSPIPFFRDASAAMGERQRFWKHVGLVCLSTKFLDAPCNAEKSRTSKRPRLWSNSDFWKMVTASRL